MQNVDGREVDEVEACVEQQYAALVRAVTPFAASRADAEDAVQEAFVRAFARSRDGKGFVDVGAWVVTVALNHLRSGWRRRATADRAAPRLAIEAEGPASDADAAFDLRAALVRLPRRQRESVVLHYFLDLDIARIAEVLGVSQGTVKTALHRARQSLLEILGDTDA